MLTNLVFNGVCHFVLTKTLEWARITQLLLFEPISFFMPFSFTFISTILIPFIWYPISSILRSKFKSLSNHQNPIWYFFACFASLYAIKFERQVYLKYRNKIEVNLAIAYLLTYFYIKKNIQIYCHFYVR